MAAAKTVVKPVPASSSKPLALGEAKGSLYDYLAFISAFADYMWSRYDPEEISI
jgi:hypothetical protein